MVMLGWIGAVFLPVPAPLQTVQQADFFGTIMALQAFWPGHLGVDNLDVVRTIARLLDHGTLSTPLPWVKDGDLIATVKHMILARVPETVRITKTKGHATQADVEQCGVRVDDKFGNAEAHTVADLGSSLKRLWTSGVPWPMPGAFGTHYAPPA